MGLIRLVVAVRVCSLAGAITLLAGCPDDTHATGTDIDAASDTDVAADGGAVDIEAATGAGDAGTADAANDRNDSDTTNEAVRDADAMDGEIVERKITIVFAASDLPPQYVCLAGFQPDGDGHAQGPPVHARGPFGIFDPVDPQHRKLSSGFPYGAVVSLPIRARDSEFFDALAPIGYVLDDVDTKEFAGFGVDSDTCKRAFATIQGTPARQLAFARGELAVGQSWVAGLSGCAAASPDLQCAGGSNLRSTTAQLDLASPSSFSGAGEDRLGVQFLHLSAFPPYRNVDVYLQPANKPDAGDGGGAAAVSDGPPLLLAGGSGAAAGVDWGSVATKSVGVALAAADEPNTLLLVVRHGEVPFCGGQPACMNTIAIPVQPFVTRYASASGGATGAAWSGNQVFALFGRTPLDAGEAPSSVLRLGVFAAGF